MDKEDLFRLIFLFYALFASSLLGKVIAESIMSDDEPVQIEEQVDRLEDTYETY
jgi:hypothetical protein